jgi:hypothetical protein
MLAVLWASGGVLRGIIKLFDVAAENVRVGRPKTPSQHDDLFSRGTV